MGNNMYTSKFDALDAVFSIMQKIEDSLKQIERSYNEIDPVNGLVNYDRQYSSGGEYQWLLEVGLLGALAQINGQRTFKGAKTPDYIVGVLNGLYSIDERWADTHEYKILSNFRCRE